jgi:hypothetical protein
MPRPEARPQRPIATPREAEPMRNAAAPITRPPQGQARNIQNDRPAQGWSHPQAKPAPPVQQRNEAQARDDENKFRNWQQQRQQTAPQNRAVQQQHPPEATGKKEQENRPK